MSNQKITRKQMQSILFMFWTGSLVVTASNKEVKQDFWICILISALLFLPIICIYDRLIKLYPGKNLFEINDAVFGKIVGRIITAIYTMYAILLASQLTKILAVFIRVVNLAETPELITAAFMVLVGALVVTRGPENIARLAKFTWLVIVTFILFTFFAGFKNMEFSNMLPVMNSDFPAILKVSAIRLILPLGESVLCLSLISNMQPEENIKKIFLKALVFNTIIYIIVAVRDVAILGLSTNMYYFPSYEAVSIISLKEFFSRFEVLIGINLMLNGSIKFCVCLYASSLGLSHIFKLPNYKAFTASCAILIITLMQLLYKDLEQFFNFVPYGAISSVPYEIILPIATWIGAEIRARISSGTKSSKTSTNNSPEKT
ncbi:GerAB/ArcD/ProY family transporter [Caproiciproducens sp. LBM24188]